MPPQTERAISQRIVNRLPRAQTDRAAREYEAGYRNDLEISYPTLVIVQKGAVFLEKGEVAKILFILLDGVVATYSPSDGMRRFIFDFHQPPAIFGLEAAIDEEPQARSLQAYDDCTLLAIPVDDIRTSLLEDPDLQMDRF